MAQGKKITKRQWDKFLKILEEMIGLIDSTCEKVKISRWSYYQHRKEDSEFAKEADLVMDQIGIPFAEDRLREALSNNEGWAIRFYLQCKSKKWRPVERREFPAGLKVEIQQKIRVDPIFKRAVKFYENELKKEYRGLHRGKHPRLDKRKKDRKRKRGSD